MQISIWADEVDAFKRSSPARMFRLGSSPHSPRGSTQGKPCICHCARETRFSIPGESFGGAFPSSVVFCGVRSTTRTRSESVVRPRFRAAHGHSQSHSTTSDKHRLMSTPSRKQVPAIIWLVASKASRRDQAWTDRPLQIPRGPQNTTGFASHSPERDRAGPASSGLYPVHRESNACYCISPSRPPHSLVRKSNSRATWQASRLL